jgi:hypothetical protein
MASRVASSADQGEKKKEYPFNWAQNWNRPSMGCLVTSNMTYPYNGSLGDRHNHLPMSVKCISGPSHSDCVIKDRFSEKRMVYTQSDMYTAEHGQSSFSYHAGFLWRMWITGSS